MNRLFFTLSLFLVTSAIALVADSRSSSASNVTIDTVPVGNPGNSSDPATALINFPVFGAVNYNYRMGSFEITNGQYVEFLNAKAASDPLQLFNALMAHDITRSGSSPNYTYSPAAFSANRPVAAVNYYDTLRFINWLNNGQGNGDTETGAYTLLGGTPIPTNPQTAPIARNPGAQWYLPSADEWFKAAFYQPAALGGPSSSYWLYATHSNVDPTAAVVNSSGSIFNLGPNVATYFGPTGTFGSGTGGVSNVGGAGPLNASFYGTYDQNGNVNEWTDTFYHLFPLLMGGSFHDSSISLKSTWAWSTTPPTDISPAIGFRVMMIPEPSTGALAILSLGLMWTLRKRLTSR